MYSIKRIMVGIDLTVTDKSIIKYTAFISKIIQPEKIYFVHAEPDFEIQESLKKELPDLWLPKDEAAVKKMQKEINEHFDNPGNTKVSFDVLEGSATKAMLHWANVKNIDLLVTGRKRSRSSGILPKRLTRMMHCSALFIPKTSIPGLNKILVAVDFSDFSRLALEEAISLASLRKGTSVTCLHIYRVPQPYYVTGKTFKEMAEIMKSHAEKRFESFIGKINMKGVKVKPIYALEERNEAIRIVNNCAKKEKADLIVVGAKGRTQLAAFLVGSFTEKLMEDKSNIPLLIVKDKHNRFGLMEAIQNL